MAGNAKVDAYVGRSTKWPKEISKLRPVLLGSGLSEEIKWGKPCYCHQGKNIAILQEMNGFLALMFFKGALLRDPEGLLRAQGPSSRSAKRLELTSVADVTRLTKSVKALVDQAIAVEATGQKIGPPPKLVLVKELAARLRRDRALKKAFESLTPGRQREYNLYFASAKQAATREARIDKSMPKILAGKGFRE